MQTFYSILGVAETADETAILSAYREKIRKCHPDLHPENAKAAGGAARQVNAAKQTLLDPDRRARYDEYLKRRRSSEASKTEEHANRNTMPEEQNSRASESNRTQGNENRSTNEKSSQRRGRRRTSASPVITFISVLLGGFAGVLVALLLLAYFWKIDPVNLAGYWRSYTSTQEDLVAKSSTTSINVEGVEPPNPRTRELPIPNLPDFSDSSPKLPQEIEHSPRSTSPQSSNPKTVIEEVISSVSDATKAKYVEFDIPESVVNLQIGFFTPGASMDALPRRNPGYKGELRINSKRVVSFTKKYKWKDGEWYSLSTVHDGSEINTRTPSELDDQWFDLEGFYTAGSKIRIEYRNGQRSAVSVRLRIQTKSATSEASGHSELAQ